MNQIYSSTCIRCLPKNTQKPHSIYQINKLKGVRLRCLCCSHIKSHYTKKPLIPWDESQSFDKLTKLKEIKKNGREK